MERRASGGDRQALEALLREHARAIHDVCRFVSGPADAHDATQEALERIVGRIEKFDPDRGSFRTWALTVARNVCRDRLRRRGLERRTFIADGESAQEWVPADAPSPERVALARIETERLNEALHAPRQDAARGRALSFARLDLRGDRRHARGAHRDGHDLVASR